MFCVPIEWRLEVISFQSKVLVFGKDVTSDPKNGSISIGFKDGIAVVKKAFFIFTREKIF